MPYLHDGLDAWDQQPDGSYKRVSDSGLSAQQALVRLYGPHGP